MRVAVLLACAACSFRSGQLVGDGGTPTGDTQQITYDGPPSDWWNPAWMSRMRLSIQDPVALPMGFQVGFAHDLDAAPCTGSRDGARIVHGMTEIARVVDETPNGTWIWFALAAPIAAGATSTEYWLYCNNPSATPAPSDPTAVFDLYDDFSGASLSSRWAVVGAVSVASGVATLPNNTTFHSTATYPPGTATDFIMAPQGTGTSMYFWGGFQNGTGTSGPWMIWNTRNEAGIHPEVDDLSQITAGALTPYDTSFRLYGVENYGGSSMYRIANASVAKLGHQQDVAASISVRFDNYNSGSSSVQVTMARVRKAVDPPPTVTLGPVETFMQ